MKSMDYDRARGVFLASGIALIAAIALTAFVRGVDNVEIVATLMYAPILAAFLSFGLSAGVIGGLAAAGVYIGLRLPAIDLVGLAPIAGTLVSRVVGYVAFGALGGWSADQLRVALDRYELIDEVDPSSGIGNARSVLNALEREAHRANRYATPFSVVTSSFNGLGTDRRSRAKLRELGTKVGMSVRASDLAAHVRSETGLDRVIVVLPETAAMGAETVRSNLDSLVREVTGLEATTESVTDCGDESDPLAHLRRSLVD